MNLPEAEALGKEMLEAVKGFVARALAPLSKRIDDLQARLNAIPAGPKGDKGDPGESVRGEKGEPGAEGKSVDVAALVEQVTAGCRAWATQLFESTPKPKDGAAGAKGDKGERGANGKDADPAAIRAEVLKAVGELPAPKDGKDGAAGKDTDPETVKQLVAAAVAAIPKPADGKDGAPGARGPAGESIKGDKGDPGANAEPVHPDTIARMVLEEVQRVVAALPHAKDGEPGRDALAHDILPGIDESKSYPRGTFAEHRGGVIRAIRNTDPITGGLDRAGWVVSMNGIADETEETLDEGRTIKRRTVYTNGRELVRESKTSAVIYRGVWREGEFQRGDVATWSGCSWHCEKPTTDKPGTSDAWKMMVKSGRDGKDGKLVAPPAKETVKIG